MKQNKVLTLYYHRINTLESDFNLLCVSPTRFRQQMLYLKRNYQIIRFEDDWSLLDQDAVAITFDDGYKDNLENALPILKELEIPATVFVSTGTMGQDRELWWDELENLLLVGKAFPQELWLDDTEFHCRWRTDTYEHRKNCYTALHYLMKNYAEAERRDDWLRQLWQWKGAKRKARKENLTLSAQECRRLAESKVISIGAHTVSHPSLAGLDRQAQEREAGISIECLSRILQKEITLFSYPFGNPEKDFNEVTIDICRRMGIRKAATTECALWNQATDPYKIPRRIVRNWGVEEFEQKIREYWEKWKDING